MRKLLVALLLVSCSSPGTGTNGSPEDRSPPLAPESLTQLLADGATCVDGPPSVCTTTDPSCVLTYDANGLLTHLRCEVLDAVFECTRPCGTDFVCRWSDDPSCADVYTADGVFVGDFCGAALSAQVPCATTPPPAVCPQLDEMSCRASAACKPGYCVAADGTESYGGCYGPNDNGPVCMINPPPPDACAQLDERQCAATDACRGDSCSLCGQEVWNGCHSAASAPPPCPAALCVSCRGQDEQGCLTDPACKPDYCVAADGTQTYGGCYGAGDVVPMCMATPPIPDDACRQLDEMTCPTKSVCAPAYCPDANGNEIYSGCYSRNTAVPTCRN